MQIIKKPSVESPSLQLRLVRYGLFDVKRVETYSEVKKKDHQGTGVVVILASIPFLIGSYGSLKAYDEGEYKTDYSIVGGEVQRTVRWEQDKKWLNGVLVLGGLGVLFLGAGIYRVSEDFDPEDNPWVHTDKTIKKEQETSPLRSDTYEYVSRTNLTVTVLNKTRKLRIDESGQISIDMVEDFGLLSFDKPETITLHLSGENPKLEEHINVSSTDWTVPYVRISRSQVDVREKDRADSRVIGKVHPGEEYRVKSIGTNVQGNEILYGNKSGWISSDAGKVFWSIPERFDPKRLPSISIASVKFEEPSGDNFLDAEETGTLRLSIANSGRGPGYRLSIKLIPIVPKDHGLLFQQATSFGTLQAGEKKEIQIPITAPMSVKSQQVKFKIEVTEANGFDADPAELTFETRVFRPPELAVADVGIDDANGNGIIELGESIDIIARIQNKGQGEAKDVVAEVIVQGEGQNIFYHAASKRFSIGSLKSGEYRDIAFTIVTNKRFEGQTLPVGVLLEEKRVTYNKDHVLNLPLNRPVKRAEEFVVKGKDVPITIPDVAGLTIDVDVDIPKTTLQNPDAVAVVIGISRYQNRDVYPVDYARRDATIMKEYLANAMGFARRRIIEVYDGDATLGAFKRVFEEQLPNYVRDGKSDVFVFYSGHGAPDPETKEAFFVPYDCNPTYAKSTGYRVTELYERLSKLNASSITVVIDACFSGSSERGPLLKAISPVFLAVEKPLLTTKNGVVFTSSTGQQVATWYHERKHGLFTYYFLKGLRGDADLNKDKQITVEEMERYLLQYVPDQASYQNRKQTPEVQAIDKQRVLVRYY